MQSINLTATTTDNCRYCLMCRHVCPVGYVTNLETLTPHGWGLMIAAQRRGMIDWNAETVEVIYSCADCGTCRSHCVTDQPLPDAIAAVRADIVHRQLASAAVAKLEGMFEKWGNPYRQQTPEISKGQGDVALFVGDEARYLWPETIKAALTLLTTLGVKPVPIGIGRNSGYLASSLGFPETARSLALANIEELKGSRARRLLVLSPGDYYTFHQLHEERLGIQWPEDVELIEVTMFLADQLDAGKLKFVPSDDTTPYTYVDPTHALRVPARHEAPRQLIASVLSTPRRELFWRRERTHPVGNTALQFANPKIAEKLTRARLQDAQQAGAQILISEDAGTLHELNNLASEYNLRIQGLYELLAAQLSKS